jgi:hypothetical protein
MLFYRQRHCGGSLACGNHQGAAFWQYKYIGPQMWGQNEQRIRGVDRGLEAIKQDFAWIHIAVCYTSAHKHAINEA